jgi:hypothetical protein
MLRYKENLRKVQVVLIRSSLNPKPEASQGFYPLLRVGEGGRTVVRPGEGQHDVASFVLTCGVAECGSGFLDLQHRPRRLRPSPSRRLTTAPATLSHPMGEGRKSGYYLEQVRKPAKMSRRSGVMKFRQVFHNKRLRVAQLPPRRTFRVSNQGSEYSL